MSVLRGYDLVECDRAGVPLDWECCRACEGTRRVVPLDERGGPMGFGPAYRETREAIQRDDARASGRVPESSEVMRERRATCIACGGHGSLRAAALAELTTPAFTIDTYGPTYEIDLVDGEMREIAPARKADPPDLTVRCWECRHPMSDGTWEGDLPRDTLQAYLAAVERWLREAVEPDPRWAWVHWSPCDEGCRHGGPGRCVEISFPAWTQMSAEEWRGLMSPTQKPEASWRQVDVRTLGPPYDLRPEKLAVLCLRCYAERTR